MITPVFKEALEGFKEDKLSLLDYFSNELETCKIALARENERSAKLTLRIKKLAAIIIEIDKLLDSET